MWHKYQTAASHYLTALLQMAHTQTTIRPLEPILAEWTNDDFSLALKDYREGDAAARWPRQ